MWYLTRTREHKGSQMSRARCSCVYCGASSEHEMGSCIVTVQDGNDEEVYVVYQAEYPPQGNCKSVIEALIMANNVHQEDLNSHKMENFHGVYGAFQSRTLEHIASFCAKLAGRDGKVDKAITWADVVKEVAVPRAAGFWRTCEIALILMESDEGSTSRLFRNQEFRRVERQTMRTTSHEIRPVQPIGQCGHEGEYRCQETGHKGKIPAQHSFLQGGRQKLS